MIGYAMVGTNDLSKAVAFYEKVFEPLGVKRLMEQDDYFVAWGKSMEETSFCVTKPFDGNKASVGNGTMIALLAGSRENVDKIHALALENGGSCEGEPGIRPEGGPSFYVAYFRDLDGNKLNVFHVTPQE